MVVKTGFTQEGTDNRGDDSPKASAVLAAVVGALYDLHRHRDASTLWEKILAVVPRMIACDSALWVRVEPDRQSFTFAAWPADRFAASLYRGEFLEDEAEEAWLLPAREYYRSLHVLALRGLAYGAGAQLEPNRKTPYL